MGLKKDTESLVEEFSDNPGAEKVDLEFKSKEILDSTGQKKELVRRIAAIANAGGGTIIIGVRREGSDIRLQGFEPDEEARQELTHIAQQYTKPNLIRSWEIEFDDCLGNRLLRIDVDEPTSRLIKFDYDGEDRVFLREEDGMREMSSGEIDEFHQNVSYQQSLDQGIERTEHVSFTPEPVDTDIGSKIYDRAVTRVPDSHNIIFGSGVLGDRIGKSLTYSLVTQPKTSEGYSFTTTILESAEKYLGANTSWSFGYSIRKGDIQLMGSSISALREDLGRLTKIANFLEEKSSVGWNYGPVLAGYTRCEYGILWFEVQQESETFTRWNIELTLPDIPFDDTDVKSFFDEIGTEPSFYSQKSGLQYIHLNGRKCGPLQNPQPIDILGDDEIGTLHTMVDNPFFDWPEAFESELETSLPDWCARGLESITRMPFQVSGGYVEEQNDEFSLNYFDFTYVSGTHPTILIDCSCWQK